MKRLLTVVVTVSTVAQLYAGSAAAVERHFNEAKRGLAANGGGGNNGGGNNGGGNNGGGNNGGGNNGGGNNGGGDHGGGDHGGGDDGGGDDGGGDDGGGDDGGGDDGGSDDGGDNGSDNGGSQGGGQQAEAEKKKLKFKLGPAFFFDFNFSNKVLNQTPQDAKFSDGSRVSMDFSGDRDTLAVEDYRNGFRVIRKGRLDVGVGVSGRWYYDNARGAAKLFGARVGIIPITGKSILGVQYAATEEAIKALPSLEAAPLKSQDLETWSVGDNVTYESRGGILFFAGVSQGIVGLNGVILSEGTWTFNYPQVDEMTEMVFYG